jgi:hypothetical protein
MLHLLLPPVKANMHYLVITPSIKILTHILPIHYFINASVPGMKRDPITYILFQKCISSNI